MDAPDTHYVAVGDADVAYHVLGEGPPDLLYFYGLGSHIELWWESSAVAGFLTRLASFSRLIAFDRRGAGASDGVPRNAIPTWEQWTEDAAAVLDAAGSTRTAILAALDAGPVAILFAATHPETVSALALFNSTARYLAADDYPIGLSPEAADAAVEIVATGWGTPAFAALSNPSAAASRWMVSGRGRRLTPRSRSLISRTLRCDRSASAACVKNRSARRRRRSRRTNCGRRQRF